MLARPGAERLSPLERGCRPRDLAKEPGGTKDVSLILIILLLVLLAAAIGGGILVSKLLWLLLVVALIVLVVGLLTGRTA
jgi:hypothetical protein